MNKRLLRKVGSAVAATSLLSAGLIAVAPTVAHADVIGKEECYPAVLMLRGSGEPLRSLTNGVVDYKNSTSGTSLFHTNGFEGPTIGALLENFANTTDPLETVSKVRFIGIEYTAHPVETELPAPSDTLADNALAGALGYTSYINAVSSHVGNHLSDFVASMNEGAEVVVNKIKEDELRGCDTQYMLVGYSQGALAARVAMNLLNNDKETIVSSYVIGDPFQEGKDTLSSWQQSPAHTGGHNDGSVRAGIKHLRDAAITSAPLAPIHSGSAIASLTALETYLAKSDTTAYRDDYTPAGGFYSRSLCHSGDPACSIPSEASELSGISTESHNNYFNANSSQGTEDIGFEVSKFNQQVRILAESQTFDPRERALTTDQALTGLPSTYSVHNARIDDKCEWDIGSNGIYDTAQISCIDLFSHTPTSGVDRMTVRVTDSFGEVYIFSTEAPVIDTKAIEAIVPISEASWYSLRPHSLPDQCLSLKTDFYRDLPAAFDANSHPIINCPDFGAMNANEKLLSSSSVFQPKTIEAANGITSSQLRLGYDDNYSLAPNYSNPSLLAIAKNDSGGPADLYLKLARIEGTTPYYLLELKTDTGVLCLSYSYFLNYETCDLSSTSQLFKAEQVNENYGALSINRAIPEAMPFVNLTFSDINNGEGIRISWDLSYDSYGRTHSYYVMYQSYATDPGEYFESSGWSSRDSEEPSGYKTYVDIMRIPCDQPWWWTPSEKIGISAYTPYDAPPAYSITDPDVVIDVLPCY